MPPRIAIAWPVMRLWISNRVAVLLLVCSLVLLLEIGGADVRSSEEYVLCLSLRVRPSAPLFCKDSPPALVSLAVSHAAAGGGKGYNWFLRSVNAASSFSSDSFALDIFSAILLAWSSLLMRITS